MSLTESGLDPMRGVVVSETCEANETPGGSAAPTINVANGLTVLRLILAVVLCGLLLMRGIGWWALVLFLGAAATDWSDGWIARRWSLVTQFGALVDPIADKVLILGALLCLSWLGLVPWWITGIIVVRDVAITVLRFTSMAGQDRSARWHGKVKTTILTGAVALYLAPLPATWAVSALQFLAITVAWLWTLFSMGAYLRHSFPL